VALKARTRAQTKLDSRSKLRTVTTTVPIQPESQMPEQRPQDRRRSKRIPMSFHIEVSGIDSNGQLFRDRVVTIDVSDGGCQFELAREIEARTPISIQVVNRDGAAAFESKPLLFEVVRVELNKVGRIVGAMQLQAANIWHMTFPLNRTYKLPR
jgi:hypothetical protein